MVPRALPSEAVAALAVRVLVRLAIPLLDVPTKQLAALALIAPGVAKPAGTEVAPPARLPPAVDVRRLVLAVRPA